MATLYASDLDKPKPSSDFKITDVTRGTATGALIGLTGGALYAYFYQKKFFTCIVVGTLAGGLLSRIFLIKK